MLGLRWVFCSVGIQGASGDEVTNYASDEERETRYGKGIGRLTGQLQH